MTDRRTANDTTDRPALPSAAAGGGRVAAKQASCIPLPVVAYSSRLPKRVELSELASREALLAQKRSSDVALAETQIAAERDLKRARLEAQALVSEKAELASRIKILERRLAEAESETAAIRRQLEQSKIESQAKIDAIVESHRQEDNLAEKCETINAELVDLRTRLEAKAAENKSLQTAIETVEAKLEASERKCEDLMQLRTEDKAALDEVKELKSKIRDLESENASLKDNYERISRGPGNASSLVSRPDGSGLCLRSSSILQSTRLEQRVAKLESENADLRRSASQLAVAHTEVEGLKAHLERANQWRERALLAEDKVAKLADERDSTAASLVDKHVLLQSQRENEILLADQGQLRSECVDIVN
uniref:Spindle assembly checkpoint component MAD1 n=1 Tax=Mesocestoides corti TaxID=53468 RepID=A0A5K3FLF3_MESCO